MSSENLSSEEGTTADRREARRPPAPTYGELVVESSWRPADRPPVQSEGWLIAHGYAAERRRG
jgi:hypothetical protein